MKLTKIIAITFTACSTSIFAQGLFSSLANKQDEIKKVEEEFGHVFSAYKPFFLIKGEMGKKEDGAPDIDIDGDGNVLVSISLGIDKDKYGAWLASATNTFAKHAIHVIAPGERPTPEDAGKPRIRVDETVFVFPEDFASAINSAKEQRAPQNPFVAVFLTDSDGNVIAEPKSAIQGDRATSVAEDAKLFTSDVALVSGGNSAGDVFMWLFCGGKWTDFERGWAMYWQDVARKIIGRKEFLDNDFPDRHHLSIESFPENGPLHQISSGNTNLGYKGEKSKIISFGQLPKEKLEAVQGVQVCVGGVQYVNFLKTIKDRAVNQEAEPNALSHDESSRSEVHGQTRETSSQIEQGARAVLKKFGSFVDNL